MDDETGLESKHPHTERNLTIEEAVKSKLFAWRKVKAERVMP